MTAEPDALARMRSLVRLLLVFGIVATSADLILVGHYEDSNQLIPLVLGGVGLVVLGWSAVRPGIVAVRTLQFVMLSFVGAGVIGATLHFKANVAAQREADPALTFRQLLPKVLESTAPPLLSPGLMVQLGLLGLLSCYRHPVLRED
jgi:hypothetical protein